MGPFAPIKVTLLHFPFAPLLITLILYLTARRGVVYLHLFLVALAYLSFPSLTLKRGYSVSM
jgi:hypothetical protein